VRGAACPEKACKSYPNAKAKALENTESLGGDARSSEETQAASTIRSAAPRHAAPAILALCDASEEVLADMSTVL
jgi:hypothetical protein